MALLGEGFRAGLRRPQFLAVNPAGPVAGVVFGLVLLAINLFLQVSFGAIAQISLFGAFDQKNIEQLVRSMLLGVLPAAVVTAFMAWVLAGVYRGAPVREVLNLRAPRLGFLGWLLVVAGFFVTIIVMFMAISKIVELAGFNPKSGGLVEETMSGMTGNRMMYFLALPSIILGAPLGEELIFRGQMFVALSQTRIGFLGASLITSAGWASLHWSGNWMLVILIFFMGLVLCVLLRRFGSLWVTMACHAAWNASTALLIFAAGSSS